MRADNSHHLRAAARRRTLATRERAVRALRRLDATGRPITIDAVAREANVSRSYLYGQADLRAQIQRLRVRGHSDGPAPPVPARQRASNASLRRRLEAVNAEIHRLRQETNGYASSSPRHLGSVEQHTSSGRQPVQALPSLVVQPRSGPAPDSRQPRQDRGPPQDLRCPSRRMRSILVDEMRPFG